MAKLTIDDFEEIRQRCANGEMQKKLAEEYGVDPSYITCIKKGRRDGRGHRCGDSHPKSKTTIDQVIWCRQLYADTDLPIHEIARRVGIPHPRARLIISGQTWKCVGGITHDKHKGKYRGGIGAKTAKEMRERRQSEGISIQGLADYYGVGYVTACHIIHGKRWEHAGGPIEPARGYRRKSDQN